MLYGPHFLFHFFFSVALFVPVTQTMNELEFDQLLFTGDQDDLILEGSSIFFDDFASLPFSSSSSSSMPVAGNLMASCSTPSSCSSASEAAEAEEHATPTLPMPTDFVGSGSVGGGAATDCMELMEDFGYVDLLDSNDFWDPSSIFEEDERNSQAVKDELRAMFFEWLKSNKGKISAQDMRTIKLKRATIESASQRLGNSVEGKKQLLQLILDWVENCHLKKKQLIEVATYSENPNPTFTQFGNSMNNFSPPPPPPQYMSPMVTFSPVCRYGGGNHYFNGNNYVLETAHTWPPANYAVMDQQMRIHGNCFSLAPKKVFSAYGNEHLFQSGGDKLMRWSSSATKEARKKRMVKHRHQHQNQNVKHGGGTSNAAIAQPDSRNLKSWSSGFIGPTAAIEVPSVMKVSLNNQHRQPTQEKRKEPSTETNIKFLLQKVLKQSDVGNIGRIVLPKKEAETHLPPLDSRDGIQIALEDIVTSRVWKMRYRFWPNNKSRMYILENTGDFVKENKLQEGDFIVIYSDVKCGKYLIRAVKLRHVVALGCEPVKKQAKKNRWEQHKAIRLN